MKMQNLLEEDEMQCCLLNQYLSLMCFHKK